MAPSVTEKQTTLKEFRKELVQDGVLHEGDSIGTDDETLL